MPSIYFENLSQAILFEAELKGQISDGMWENARPMNHYVIPCRAKVFIDAKNPRSSNIGNKSYNFSSKDLLDCVGDRMLDYAKVGKILDGTDLSIEAAAFVAEYWKPILKAYQGTEVTDYLKQMFSKWIPEYRITHKIVKMISDQFDSVDYTEKDMKKDLNRMKKIWKNQ